jgi:DNA-binding XRE family transcriptional regulator
MSDFGDLMHFIEDEAVAEGPAAVAQLHAFDARVRLAAELIHARQQAGMTQRELAAASGVQQAEISKIERGKIAPSIITVDKLLRPLRRCLAVLDDDS